MAPRRCHQRSRILADLVVIGVVLAVVTGCGRNDAPSVPAGTNLAYVVATPADLPGTVVVQDLHSGERRTVATRVQALGGFRWSPDGQRIAYRTRDQDGGAEVIQIASVDGDRIWTSQGPLDSAPTWGPDGDALAFVRSSDAPGGMPDPDAVRRVHVVAAEDTTARPVTDPPPRTQDHDPVWSPSGEHLAFRRVGHRGDEPGTSATTVHTVALDGGSSVRVTETFEEVRSLSWSPDGGRLAFVADGALHLVAPDGGDPRRIATEDAAPGHVAWAPDGQHIAFVGGARLHVATRGGEDEARTLSLPPISIADLAWSPAGDELAVAAHRAVEGPEGLYRIDVESDEAVRLADPRGGISDPAWSPDGRLLAFTATEEGAGLLGLETASDVFTVRPDGSELYQVTSDGNAHSPAFQP